VRILVLICVVACGCDDDSAETPDLSSPVYDMAIGVDMTPLSCQQDPNCCKMECFTDGGSTTTPLLAAGWLPPTWNGVLAGDVCGNAFVYDCAGLHCIEFHFSPAVISACYDSVTGDATEVYSLSGFHGITSEACECGPLGKIFAGVSGCTSLGAAPCLLDGGGTD
jgi:hypothetical protein